MLTEKTALDEKGRLCSNTVGEADKGSRPPPGRWEAAAVVPDHSWVLGAGTVTCPWPLTHPWLVLTVLCELLRSIPELPPPRKIGGTVIALFKSEGRMLPALMQRSCWILPILRSESSSISQTALLSRRSKSGSGSSRLGGHMLGKRCSQIRSGGRLTAAVSRSRLSEVLEDKTKTHLALESHHS